jgi:DNA-binding CsgD family transcriptional regulator
MVRSGDGTNRSVPSAGDHAILLDHRRRPREIWQTTGISIAPRGSVSEEFVWRDGAESVEDYVAAARLLFDDLSRRLRFKMLDRIEIVFESFEVVWPPAAVRRSKWLEPKFSQGLALIRRLDHVRAAARDLVSVLDRMETAVMIVGANLRPRLLNKAAERILLRNDRLRLRDGRLRALIPAEDEAIGSAVARSIRKDAPPARQPEGMDGASFEISRAVGRPPYRLRALAMPGDCLVAERLTLLLLDDPETRSDGRPADEAYFVRAFSLTPAEARLAAQLGCGASQTNAANALGIARNTARSQLRAIFDKVDVHRQSELVLLLQNARTLRLSVS